MCLIVYQPKGCEFSEEYMRKAARENRDGFGIAFKDSSEESGIKVIKTTGDADEILELYKEYKDRDLAMHFRLATHGAHNLENCHPYQVLNKEEHGRTLWVFHNGVITNV